MKHARPAMLLAAAITVASVVVVALCVTRIPPGSLGIQSRGGRVLSVMRAGAHLHLPTDDIAVVPAGARDYSGTIQVRTREGATLAIPFRLSLDLAAADPSSLLPVASGLAEGKPLDAVVTAILESLVSEAGVAVGPDLFAGRLAGLGLVPGSLILQPGRTATASAPNPLRASWTPPAWGVLLIGIDSADWDLMTPLMEAGVLPHLKSLRDRGAWSPLRSMKPTLSPLLWTTVATGRPPEDHGIIDFLMKDPASGAEIPISRLFRRVKALWNIASDFDIPNITVAWWATWPAERVSGSIVTDRVAFSLFDLPSAEGQPGLAYPESLVQEIPRLRVDVDSIGDEEIRAIVDVPQAVIERARLAIDSPEGYRDPISHLVKILAGTRTYHNIALSLLKRQKGGLAMIYYEGLDEVNHRFAHYMKPAMSLTKGADPALSTAFAGAVTEFYRLQDRLVGELLEAVSNDTVVMVVSDHGFANGMERPIDTPPDIEGRPGLWHTMDGVLIVAGPPIRPGRLDSAPGLLDLAPTLLALLGLPTAGDMPGRALTEIFRPGAAPPLPRDEVASYEQIGEPLQSVTSAGSSPQDAEMIARLRALGYVGSENGQLQGTGTPIYHVNAGQILLAQNRLDRAQEEFERARALAPRFDQALLGLAQVEVMRGNPEGALPYLEETLSVVPEPQPVLMTRAARIYIKAGRENRGIEFFSKLGMTGRLEAYRLTAVGMLQESLGDPVAALESYRRALEIDPSVERALYGAYTVLKQRGDLGELATLLQMSLDVESIPVGVRAANWLALTRELQGSRPEARAILAGALEKAPDDLMTLINLGSMLVRDDRAAEGVVHLERAYGLRPRNFEVLVNLIVAHGKIGDLDKARRYFNEGEKLTRRPELYNAIAYACFLNAAGDDAEAYLARSLAIDPQQKEAKRLKEQMDREMGR